MNNMVKMSNGQNVAATCHLLRPTVYKMVFRDPKFSNYIQYNFWISGHEICNGYPPIMIFSLFLVPDILV